MTTLPEFLLACIGNDSSVAFFAGQDEELLGSLAEQAVSDGDHRLTHAARWTPARVQAQCSARERIVQLHQEQPTPASEMTLRLLALPYADSPDYREEWRP